MMIMSDHDSKQAVEYLSQLRSSMQMQANDHDTPASAEISLRVEEKND